MANFVRIIFGLFGQWARDVPVIIFLSLVLVLLLLLDCFLVELNFVLLRFLVGFLVFKSCFVSVFRVWFGVCYGVLSRSESKPYYEL